MRALIQRVEKASVEIEEKECARIETGLLIFLGVGEGDSSKEVQKLWSKISNLRIFEDACGKTNLSVADIEGDVLVVSQFTLYADCRKGRRPSFENAMRPDDAEALYEEFVSCARLDIAHVATGKFGAMMSVSLINDGPFTIWLDTDNL